MAPRGDSQVANINKSIDGVGEQWRNQEVHVIQQAHEYFSGSNGLPAGQYFAEDGIHLSISGLKRLLDAIF